MNQLELIKAVKEASLSLKTVHTFTNGVQVVENGTLTGKRNAQRLLFDVK